MYNFTNSCVTKQLVMIRRRNLRNNKVNNS